MKKWGLVYKRNPMTPAAPHTNIYTVSRLTGEIASLLEENFPFVWVAGEISNYALPASGHAYFSLKDNNAMIGCVMFRNQLRSVKFNLENGLRIMGLARISVYAPRGTYQLIFEHLEPEGAGALSLAFEQLKKKLSEEGLFDEIHKKTIASFPRDIAVITSGTGAAVQDIIKVSAKRCPCCALHIVPVKVQGDGADREIIQALDRVNEKGSFDTIILARGGGSAEDLSVFNSEALARAIFASRIPVVTGVGHETDFTIADFVADLRTPTPSAAALAALPDQSALLETVENHFLSLKSALERNISDNRQAIHLLESRLKDPSRIIYDYRLKLEDLENRTGNAIARNLAREQQSVVSLVHRLKGAKPEIQGKQRETQNLARALENAMETHVRELCFQIKNLDTRLESMNPVSVLNRGYSIVRTCDTGQVITDEKQTHLNQAIEIVLAKGEITARVETSKHGKKENI